MTDGLEEMGLPPLGHNKPPDEVALFDTVETLTTTVNRWLAERPTITDKEMAGAGQLLIDQLRTIRDKLDAALKAEREPVDLMRDAINIKFKVPADMVDLALDNMAPKMKDWLQRERDRLADEQRQRERDADAAIADAARLTHEAEQPGASLETQRAGQVAEQRAADLAKAARRLERPRVKGDYAKRAMGLTSRWKARVVDERAALKHFAKHPDIRAAALVAIVKLCNPIARAHRGQSTPPPGVEFYNDEGIT